MDALLHDIRFAIRTALKAPIFTGTIVLTLALGIGANTAIFSMVDAVLLAKLPYHDPDTLVRITGDYRGSGMPDIGLSVPELDDYKRRPDVFLELAGVYPITANITGGDQPERVETLLAGGNYFTLLGATAQIGRVFDTKDEIPGIAEVAVISDGLWHRRFGADPAIVGRKVRLDEDNYTIIGVMPASFRHPGHTLVGDVDFWAPTGYKAAPFRAPARTAYFLDGALARLAPGVTIEQASAALDALGQELTRQYPNDYPERRDWHPRVVPLKDDLVASARPALLTLFAAVAAVLLIGCVNVANLLLARATSRQREIAIRRALGAGRLRLVRQMLTESLLLSIAGGLVACLVSGWAVDALVALTPATIHRVNEIAPNLRLLAFTLGVSIVTGLLFGLVPALQSAGRGAPDKLKDGGRPGSAAHHQSVRRTLVTLEFALALVLLVGAGLLIRSFAHLANVDLGFKTGRVLVARLWLPQPNDPPSGPYFKPENRLAFIREAIRRVSSIPGVELVGIATASPLDGTRSAAPFTIEGRQTSSADQAVAYIASASGSYFPALGIPLVRGRFFADTDGPQAMPVALVNEALAARHWPGEDAVGKRLKLGGPGSTNPWLTIVGIIRDVKTDGPDAPNRPLVYRSILQASSLSLTIVVRGAVDPGTLGESIRREVAATDARIPVYGVRTMEQVVDASVGQRRFAMELLGLFALVALLLSAVGIYGVMSYTVSQRTQEIGIRMALGAQRGDVHRLIIGQGLGMSIAGIALGLLAAFALTRWIRTLLFEVAPTDPLTFVSVSGLLAAVALLACYLPARRAADVQPMHALRWE
jgi:putative ABC transport system permease protein